MASITKQTNSIKSILDIYNNNPLYIPTKDSIVLMSTSTGTTVAVRAEDLIKFPKIFKNKLSSLYSDDGPLKDNLKLRG